MRNRIILSTLCVCCLGYLSGCRDTEEVESGKPVVYVSVPPYESIASRIAGDAFDVRSIVSENDDPHSYSPTPKQVAQLAQASIFFTGEMPFEHFLIEKVTAGNSKIKVFSLTRNIELLEGSCELCASHGDEDEVYVYVKGEDEDPAGHPDHADHDHADHDHADHDHADHDHAHRDHEKELDPHVWLSPKILKLQAETMAGVLKNAEPAATAQIDQNLKSVLADLDSLDSQLAEKLAFMKGQTFYVYHGAFAYFAQAYGLKQEAIEVGGRRPEPKRLAGLIEKAKQERVKLIFVQPQFDQSSAKSLAEAIGGKVLLLDPLEKDIFGNLRKIAENVGQSTL